MGLPEDNVDHENACPQEASQEIQGGPQTLHSQHFCILQLPIYENFHPVSPRMGNPFRHVL